jgi:hypothetical protein
MSGDIKSGLNKSSDKGLASLKVGDTEGTAT